MIKICFNLEKKELENKTAVNNSVISTKESESESDDQKEDEVRD